MAAFNVAPSLPVPPGPVGKKERLAGVASCVRCKQLKMRCVKLPGIWPPCCERCQKTGKTCLPAPPSRQGKRPRSNDHVSDLTNPRAIETPPAPATTAACGLFTWPAAPPEACGESSELQPWTDTLLGGPAPLALAAPAPAKPAAVLSAATHPLLNPEQMATAREHLRRHEEQRCLQTQRQLVLPDPRGWPLEPAAASPETVGEPELEIEFKQQMLTSLTDALLA